MLAFTFEIYRNITKRWKLYSLRNSENRSRQKPRNKEKSFALSKVFKATTTDSHVMLYAQLEEFTKRWYL